MTIHLDDALQELSETLDAIERVLKEEYAALRTLDGPAIEGATSQKESLNTQLKLLVRRVIPTAETREAVARIRTAAQTNQILLLHARACVKGALSVATGSPAPDSGLYTTRKPPSVAPPVRLNMRG